jgi:hypothetical protein
MIKRIVIAFTGVCWLCGTPVWASACMDEVVRLEQKLRDAASNPADQPTGVQSIGAQLSHQPTPESVEQAELKADATVRAILSRAKAYDSEDKYSECEELVAHARLHFGPQ